MLSRVVITLLLMLHTLFATSVDATQISIVNLDGANEGFNENTVAAPVGGNIGTTLGQQRLIVFQYAARIWESIIDSDIEIKVEAEFDPLTCSSGSAVLGSAGATTVYRDFANAPYPGTWYSIALANSLAGSDLSPSADISATFNSEIDNNNNCLNNTNWYYGIDGNKPSNSIDLLSVVMHEIGHGLGFQTFVDITTGDKLGRGLGNNDAFMLRLEDHSTGKTWGQMNNNERLASVTDSADLHWTGAGVTSRVADYSAGIDQGHVRHYAPAVINQGSSVSHFDSALSPNELMEPFITQPKTGPGLAVELMADIGWNIFPSIAPIISTMADLSLQQGSTDQVAFAVGDNDTPLASLTFSFDITDTAIIDQAGLSVSGAGVARTLNITANGNASGTTEITITVSDGINTTTETFQLTVSNASPVVTIESPLNDDDFIITDSIFFQATATDLEDGDISAGIQWLSDIDGSFAVGNSIAAPLSAGTHLITASATDSGTLGSNDSITINVYGDADNDGMNDLWELDNFETLDRDGSGDFDSDGISDLDEYLISIAVPDGDINGNGAINAGDLILVTKHVLGNGNLSPLQVSRGDLYPPGQPDGVINLSDLILMQQLVLQ
jgi:hypothetical protein